MKCFGTIAISAIIISLSVAAEWNYDRADGANGPDGWTSGSCTGNRNSPIDIKAADTEKEVPVQWTKAGWDSSHQWDVKNSGYSATFNLDGASSVMTSGGGLEYIYDLVQFHFHWGATNDAGSEHLVEGKSYPLEVHFVHAKSKFNRDLTAALGSGEGDALAVLGYFFEVSESDNTKLNAMVSAIESIQNTTAEADGVTLPSIQSMFGDATDGNWWRYEGGLTTPPCNEQVIWTVFQNTVKISAAQLAAFRDVDSGSHTELYRPPVALNERTVYLYAQGYTGSGYTGSAATASLSFGLMATLLGAFL